jgi:capsular exopolysaccharide synthesis family protein
MNWLGENTPPAEIGVSHDRDLENPLSLDQIPIAQVVATPEMRLIYQSDPHSVGADRFRLMRLRLQSPWFAGRVKKLLVTSPLPGDGKSTIALNLSAALSENGKSKVLLIEADLHHSPLSRTLGLDLIPGLAECLQSSLNPLGVVRHLMPLDWYLLPAGHARMNPAELFQGPELPKVMGQLSAHFDWLVLDSSPVILLSEALSLKEQSDASLLVVRAGRTSQDVVEDAIRHLGKGHLLGMVLNGVELSDLKSSKYGDYYYRGRSEAKRQQPESRFESREIGPN